MIRNIPIGNLSCIFLSLFLYILILQFVSLIELLSETLHDSLSELYKIE